MMLMILKKKDKRHREIMVSSNSLEKRAENLTNIWMIEEDNNHLQIKLAGIVNNQYSQLTVPLSPLIEMF